MNKLTKILLWLWFLPFTIDLATMLVGMVREGHTMSETNVVFLLLGGNIWLFLGYIAIINYFMYLFIKASERHDLVRYMVIVMVVFVFVARFYGIYTNITHIINPVTVDMIASSPAATKSYSVANKIYIYMKLVFTAIILPFGLHIIIFKLLKLDYTFVKRSEKK